MTIRETAEKAGPTVLLTEATVHSATRLSPSYVRVELASPGFVDLGEEGFDTRFKVLLPGATGELLSLSEVAEEWYERWVSLPDDVRPPMRTYTIRDVVRDRGQVRLVVDFVVHEDDGAGAGHGLGPACRWALAAKPGDVVQVVAPHRATTYGGAEFDPDGRQHVLLIGDETAVPAIARIMEDLGPGCTGEVFLEVPSSEDIQDLPGRTGFSVTWCPRHKAAVGRRLVQDVRRHLGLPPSTEFEALADLPGDLDLDVWETPTYSAAGEDVEAQLHTHSVGHDLDDTYAWIAGESWMVKALRRSMVTELGVDRGQVAFMGYWREGVAMRG
ncbi:MAG: siderophore-interacting protein [Marmoricola sp.]|nr:siderophore-interacting protein [Marmoricola sp.]